MEFAMPATTLDCKGQSVVPGDRVRVLGITIDQDMDEDDLDMFMEMVGSTCEVERIDADGTAWVVIWWNVSDGSLTTSVGLEPQQMEKLAA
jgi:hypothetical protein